MKHVGTRALKPTSQGPTSLGRTLGSATKEYCKDAGVQFLIVVRCSGVDIEADMRDWVNSGKGFPFDQMSKEAHEILIHFLCTIAVQIRVLMKMSRIGVAMKLMLPLGLGYADVLTDFLVAKSYYDVGKVGTAYAMAVFAVFSIVIQALFTFFQYGRKSKRERLGHTLLALLGLAPLPEGWSVWTGKEDVELMFTGGQMYAAMIVIEIGGESIPESIIQIGGLLDTNYGDIQTIQIIGVISSIVSAAFIMTDANLGINLSKYLSTPGIWGGRANFLGAL
ncbi:hypothetical protein TL16_g12264 [Triparma laevis f. inornata]|uniref:Uncharacterized protein n=1 Tax=Triparma laevis f. inornata TaxID=1714386 RepID=A0A9W7EVJ1_9STRA|nr:hypothetical protein TL16_g12264 [Triparma laevis f. inornata]